ncbi:KaiB domain protein [Chloroherpeton thalassium ATCC 35110]|uniref:KaiB domain protein n=1 Tax=Chloroherpeton thalassium (strain ATCC 35110 / GB-78) TaxID=517418 RepID=B3QX05_CHLT3|nr:circadian clock KaiB family protein [Chloroherpeton thalassium]ACF14815.1 KaiB domain protein [Chloroherpeton thalassium ATCC 35110]
MAKFKLTLYITGHTPRSEMAIFNLRNLCENKLSGEYELEIVDVLENPEIAEKERILATPTLMKLSPPPTRRITGDLSDHEKLINGLDLHKLNNRYSEKSE